jgi:hypothetical protein
MTLRDKIDALTATTDVQGNTIAVGDRVRSFDFPLYLEDRDCFLGIDTEGDRVAFVEGIVEAIGEDVMQGCARYRIRIEREVCIADGKTIPDCYGAGHEVFPPVNGTPSWMHGRTFGVVKVDPRERLFAGVFTTGISYADRTVEEHGDMKRLAFLDFGTLQLEVRPDCPSDLRPLIETDAAAIQAKRGEQYQVSAAGQTVTLGHRL